MLLALWTRNPGAHSDLPPTVVWLIVAGFIAFFVLIFWAAARAKRKRREGLEQFALESGFSFSAEADPSIAQELAPLNMTVATVSPRVRYENVLRGSRGGREVVIVDRIAGQGKSQSMNQLVATKFETPLPPFYVCAENFLFHILEKFGYSDIDLESAPEFSRRFFLHSDKPEEVRPIFTPDVTLVFEQLPQDSALCVQSGGRWLAVYRLNRPTSPAQLRDLVGTAEKIADALHRGQEAAAKWK